VFVTVGFGNTAENVAVDFDLTGNVGMGAAMYQRRFIHGQDNNFDPAIIKGIRQFNQYSPIFDLFK
jgi:hypothetical protein